MRPPSSIVNAAQSEQTHHEGTTYQLNMPVTEESCATIISTSGRIQGLTYAIHSQMISTRTAYQAAYHVALQRVLCGPNVHAPSAVGWQSCKSGEGQQVPADSEGS